MSQADLHAHIIELSEATEWDEARKEWELASIHYVDEPDTCPCGHRPINEICVIKNSQNGQTTEVGNHCVRNFMSISSGNLFPSLRNVRGDIERSFNDEMIYYAHRQGIINEWEKGFYINIWRKRNLTTKQAATKQKVNEKILRKLIR